MARMRSIKPELWADRRLARLSRDARLLYIALWNFADEHARLHGDPRYIKGHCLPYDDDLGLPAIDRLLTELAAAGRVVRYEVDEDPYLWLPKLADHQRLEAEKVPSRLPAPPAVLPGPPPGTGKSEPRANESESRADESAPDANSSETNVAKHVACGREQVAGSRGAESKPRAAKPRAAKGEKHAAADDLTAQWWDRHKATTAQSFVTIRGIVRTAVSNGLDVEIVAAALERIANEGRPISGGTLQIAMRDELASREVHDNLPAVVGGTVTPLRPASQATGDVRAAQNLALVAELRALEEES